VSAEREPEDLAADRVLDELAYAPHTEHGDDTAPVSPLAGDEEAFETLRRLFLEGVGLLPYELEPVAPRPGMRERVMMSIAGDETQEVPTLAPLAAPPLASPAAPAMPAPAAPTPRPAAPPPRRDPAPSAVPEVTQPAWIPPVAAPEAPKPYREAGARRSRRSVWPTLLAALFALAAIGLGVWVAQLDSEVAYRDAQIRRLQAELAQAATAEKELAAAKQELSHLERRLTFVTGPATTVYTLQPPVGSARQPLARGHLFVAANRRDWRLEVRGLAPDAEAQDYQLWFIVDGLPMSGGTFDARLGQVAELARGDMPAGTTAVAVTLERKGGVPSPTTPILLIAESSVRI
jgi:hypothetical protein